MTLHALRPRYVEALFPPLLDALVALLRSLSPEDWERRTLAGQWRVRDVAAHLLDGDLRLLSAFRDAHLPSPSETITDGASLLRMITAQNASGVAFSGRLSTRVITDLLEVSGRWVSELVATLPPHGPSLFAVSWAGEATSENWMNTGREYTERWHHQAQIRDAVGAPALLRPPFFEPLLDISMRAWPAQYANVIAPDGSSITLEVRGEGDMAWTLVRSSGTWVLHRGLDAHPSASISIDGDDVWRLLYNALPPEHAQHVMTVSGDLALAMPFLRVRSVIV